ncbi:hypothetical protein [Chitinophaga barathri]|nr:hypothetical protein [Chitinophaga barathri]
MSVEKKYFHKSTASNYTGYKLYLKANLNDSVLTSDSKYTRGLDYSLRPFIELSDSLKLIFVGQLLDYANDTTLCCMPVERYGFDGFEGLFGNPQSKRFNTQMDALVIINRLCFPYLTNMYASYPVLYDMSMKREINDNSKLITEVFQTYKCWYEQCLTKKQILKYFPFNDTRVVWYAGKKSIEEKPKWYKCD